MLCIYKYSISPVQSVEGPIDLPLLIHLSKSCSWNEIVRHTTNLLADRSSISQFSKNEMNMFTKLRYEALFRMKMYDDLMTEVTLQLQNLEAENNHLNQESADDHFDLISGYKLLIFEVNLMTGHGQESLEHLLRYRKQLSGLQAGNGSVPHRATYWLWHAECHIVNTSIRTRNWKRAIKDLTVLSNMLRDYLVETNNEEEKCDYYAARIVILCRLTKILLQVSY